MSTPGVVPFVEAVGWTLLNFLWQAAAVALVFWCVLRMAGRSPQVKYVAGCVTLLLMFTGAAATFAWQWSTADRSAVARTAEKFALNDTPDVAPLGDPISAKASPAIPTPADARGPNESATGAKVQAQPALTALPRHPGLALRKALPWIVGGWAGGVALLSLRLLASWFALGRLRRAGDGVTVVDWQQRFDQLRRRMGVSRPVRLIFSAAVGVPMVIGWLRPVVLVPRHLIDALGFAQLEAILAHELAHIRRHDYLVNLLQNALETLFFYHPAVWWVSAQVRVLREHCCDDLAAAACGDALAYAKALSTLEEVRGTRPALGLAATDGPLLERIRRLAGLAEAEPRRAAWPASLLTVLIAAAVIWPLVQLSSTESATAAPAAAGPNEEEKEAQREPNTEPPIASVNIRGKAIDDETGEPVAPLVVQAGKFELDNPSQITWGFSESRSSARDGSFSTTIRWSEGWTARVLADGYLPHPVLEGGPPPPGEKTVNVVLRLKRGRLVRGQVLDHEGKPAAGASVFAIGPTGLNLAQGKAWQTWGEENEAAKPAIADKAGRFELPAGDAERVAVSSTKFDAWPAAIPDEGELVIRLPAPATVHFDYDIEGGTAKADVFYQLLGHRTPEFQRLESTRTLPVANGGRVTIASLPPGKYQFCRSVQNRLGNIGIGAMLDRQFVELAAGETRIIGFVREKGAPVRGKITWPEETKLDGIVVSIKNPVAEKQPISGGEGEWQLIFDAQTAGQDGSFLTETIPPGRHLLVAEGYAPLDETQRFRTGIVGPALRAERMIDVPETGEFPPIELPLAE